MPIFQLLVEMRNRMRLPNLESAMQEHLVASEPIDSLFQPEQKGKDHRYLTYFI